MIHKIQHTYSEEIFLPWAAMSDNIDFILNGGGQVETTDGVIADVVEKKGIHVLSQQGLGLIVRLYNIQTITFLQRWYERKKEITSLEFLYLKLKKYDGDITA